MKKIILAFCLLIGSAVASFALCPGDCPGGETQCCVYEHCFQDGTCVSTTYYNGCGPEQ